MRSSLSLSLIEQIPLFRVFAVIALISVCAYGASNKILKWSAHLLMRINLIHFSVSLHRDFSHLANHSVDFSSCFAVSQFANVSLLIAADVQVSDLLGFELHSAALAGFVEAVGVFSMWRRLCCILTLWRLSNPPFWCQRLLVSGFASHVLIFMTSSPLWKRSSILLIRVHLIAKILYFKRIYWMYVFGLLNAW